MKYSGCGDDGSKTVSCTSFSVIDWNFFQDRVLLDRIFHRVYSKEFFGTWNCLLKKGFSLTGEKRVRYFPYNSEYAAKDVFSCCLLMFS